MSDAFGDRWRQVSKIGYDRYMTWSSRLQNKAARLSWVAVVVLFTAAVSACSDSGKEKSNVARKAEAEEAAHFMPASAALAELQTRLSSHTFATTEGVYVKDAGLTGENVFLSPVPSWKIECGPLGFTLIFQPDRAENDNVELKLTWTPLSDQLCDQIVPPLGAFVRTKLIKPR